MQIKELEKICKRRRKNGVPPADLIQFLYDSDASIIDSIIIMRGIYGISLGDAKQLVAAQPCWSEVVEGADKMHEELIRMLEQESKTAPSEVKS